jgi:hypothetical protein
MSKSTHGFTGIFSDGVDWMILSGVIAEDHVRLLHSLNWLGSSNMRILVAGV